MFTANEISGVKGSDKLIRKCGKLLKIGKLSKNLKLFKLRNSNGEKWSKF